MQRYVYGRNAGPADHSDIKLPLPKKEPNGHQGGKKGHEAKNSGSDVHRGQQPNQPDSKPFYGTDASSVGDTSVSSMQQNNGRASPSQQPYSDGAVIKIEQSDSGSDGDAGPESEHEDKYDGERYIRHFGKRPNQQQINMMREMDKRKDHHANGRHLPYTQGDSYPSTTSGRLSEVAPESRNGSNPTAQQHHAAVQSAFQQRGNFHHQEAVQHRQAHPQQERRSKALDFRTKEIGLFSHPQAAPVEPNAAAGHAFSKLPAPAASIPPLAHGRQQNGSVALHAKSGSANNTSNRASASKTEKQSQSSQRAQQYGAIAAQNVTAHADPKTHRDVSTLAPVQQQRIVPIVPEYVQASDDSDGVEDARNQIPDDTVPEQHAQLPQFKLDHDGAELFGMDYHELKDESFDVDPHTEFFSLPTDQQHISLSDKLTIVSTLQQQNQIDFFAMLSLDEWEQAGDWFLGRFGEVVDKLKNARQEKRDASRRFESEIESRDIAVGKKRKQIEECFTEMKENGGKVLEGTPKKAKK